MDSADSTTNTVPIYEGFALSHAVMKINLGGKDLTEYLVKLLKESGRSFSNIPETERDNARDTKEKKCYVAGDFEAEIKSFAETNKEVTHRMPDGNDVVLGNHMIKCPEALF